MELFLQTLKSFTKKEKWLSALLILTLLFSIYFLNFSGQQNNFKSKGVYTEGIVGNILHLNPVFTEFSEADADISSLIFSGLLRYNPETTEFEEDIATYTLSEDHLSYTFTLRNNVLWQDGTEVSSDDIYFTFAEVIQSPEFNNPILKANFSGVLIEQIDSRTISFTLNSPNSFFFSALTVGLLPHHILGDVAITELDTHEFNQAPIGTGPYKITAPYEHHNDGSTSITLEINDKYYKESPQIENIRFVAYPSIAELAENRSSWTGAARLRQSQLEELDIDKLLLHRYELPQYTAIFFNTDAPITTSSKLRLGVSKAIDKKAILEVIDYKKQIDTPLLSLDQEEWIHNFDLTEAQGSLFDAGWTLSGDDTVRTNSEGEELSLRLLRRDFSNTNPIQEETQRLTAAMIQSQLSAAGIKVNIEAYPFEELQEKIVKRDYDMLLYGQSLGYNLDIFSYWHSSQATEDGLNLSNYQNPKADFYMESIRSTSDTEEQNELLKSLAKVISDDIPAVFLYTPSYYYVTSSELTGVDIENILVPHDRFANISAWSYN